MNPNFAMVNWADGSFDVSGAMSSVKKLSQLKGIFRDDAALAQMDPDMIVYRVWWWEPVAPGTLGGLFWGTTEISPGKVGKEYFMTHGHRHAVADRAEFYGTTTGNGMLVICDENGHARFEPMKPGSLHYIPNRAIHRVVNTGDAPLRFIACWPSDAGHDYALVLTRGVGARVLEEQGVAVFIPDEVQP